MEEIENKEVVEQLPSIQFAQQEQSSPVQVFENKKEDATGNLVENAFQQAVVHKVTTDESIQNQLLDGAKKVIDNKVEAIKQKADTESKEANFQNKKGACECFGYNEATTEKWAVNTMNFWHNIMTGIWILIGAITFAPITFVAKKIKVILKASWISILIAVIIYLAIASSPFWYKYVEFLFK